MYILRSSSNLIANNNTGGSNYDSNHTYERVNISGWIGRLVQPIHLASECLGRSRLTPSPQCSQSVETVPGREPEATAGISTGAPNPQPCPHGSTTKKL